MGKKVEAKQETLFAPFQDAEKLIRAADDIGNVDYHVKKYSTGTYGVKVGDACLTDRLPEDAAHMVVDHLRSAVKSIRTTLVNRAQEIMDGVVSNLMHDVHPHDVHPVEEAKIVTHETADQKMVEQEGVLS